MAVIIWESYLHENLLSHWSFINVQGHLAWDLKDKIETWDLETKTYFLPKWILGKTFDKSNQPFQDFRRLLQIRNSIVHFKWDKSPENAIKDLAQRKITLQKEGTEFSWTMELCSLSCYKWAINTLVDMIHSFSKLFPDEAKPFMADT